MADVIASDFCLALYPERIMAVTHRSHLCLAFAVVGACSSDPSSTVTRSVPPEVALAPTTVVIARDTLTLTAGVARNFMPMFSPVANGMIASATLQTIRKTPFTTTVTVDQLWVVARDSGWVANDVEVRRGPLASVEVVVRDGPPWEPQTPIEVVARVRGTDGRAQYVRVADLKVSAVY